MKRIIAILLLVVFCFSMISCTSVKIATDKGKYAFVMPEKGGVVKTTRTKMVWYALWGLLPITDNSTKDLIKAKEKVVVTTVMGPLDVLISMLLGIATIQTRTVEVQVVK